MDELIVLVIFSLALVAIVAIVYRQPDVAKRAIEKLRPFAKKPDTEEEDNHS